MMSIVVVKPYGEYPVGHRFTSPGDIERALREAPRGFVVKSFPTRKAEDDMPTREKHASAPASDPAPLAVSDAVAPDDGKNCDATPEPSAAATAAQIDPPTPNSPASNSPAPNPPAPNHPASTRRQKSVGG